MAELHWESLHTDYVGDQVADGADGLRYEIGPHDGDDWTVTGIDSRGEFMIAADVPDEVAAKAIAQRWEDSR